MIKLSVVSKEETAPKYADDPVFFTKWQIRVGAVLTHYGRLDPGSRWRVTKIVSEIRPKKRGKLQFIETESVLKLNDEVHLQRVGSPNETRAAAFSYLSYSSIWRKED
jgi:hypothetical protein